MDKGPSCCTGDPPLAEHQTDAHRVALKRECVNPRPKDHRTTAHDALWRPDDKKAGHDHDECMGSGSGALTAAGRARIKPKNFALPGGRYPIHDASHARNALARVAQHGTPTEQAKVKAAVHKKYPGIGQS